MVSSAVSDILGVLGGCMGCMVVVENIAKQERNAMNLMTFSTFFFIASVGLVVTSNFFRVPMKIPFRGYLPTVSLFVAVNVVNNAVLSWHVPVPLHIIFRSGSLLANLVLSVLWQKKSYSSRKYLSVLAITAGIIICTFADSNIEKNSSLSLEEAEKHYFEWSVGISLLTLALFGSSVLAICQQKMYERYGKHPEEAMFVTHALGLPFFLFLYSDISRAANTFNASPSTYLGGVLPLSDLWLNLAAQCVLQWVCIHFVYNLNASVDSLTVTLVVTLRKFLSLLVSIIYFQNPFTGLHWVGTFFVFAGTLAFAEISLADIWPKSSRKQKKQ